MRKRGALLHRLHVRAGPHEGLHFGLGIPYAQGIMQFSPAGILHFHESRTLFGLRLNLASMVAELKKLPGTTELNRGDGDAHEDHFAGLDQRSKLGKSARM
jgi:hypothetical protein